MANKNMVVSILVQAKDKATSVLGKIGEKVGLTANQVAALGAAALAAGAAFVVGLRKAWVAARQMSQEMADLGDSFDKMSLRTNISAEELAEWVFVLERAGGTAASVETSMKRMAKSMYDYTQNLSTATIAWREIGIDPTDSEGKLREINDVLLDLADALPMVESDAKRMALAQELLGRGGLVMAAAFANGSGPIKEQMELFKKLNGTMSKDFTDGAAQVIDAQTDMQWAIRGLKADLMTPIQPGLAIVIDEIALAVGGLGIIAESYSDDIKGLADDLVELAQGTVDAATLLGPTVQIFSAVDKVLGAMATRDVDGVVGGLDGLGDAMLNLSKAKGDLIISRMNTNLDGTPKAAGRASERLAELRAEMKRFRDEWAAEMDVKEASAPARNYEPAEIKFFEDEMLLLEDIMALEEKRRQASEDAAAAMQGDRIYHAQGFLTPGELKDLGKEADQHIERLQEMAAAEEVLADAVADVSRNFERLASDSIKAFLSGEAGALKFGTLLRTVVIDALSAVIAKLLIIKVLGGVFGGVGLFLGGGGRVPHGAAGFRVPSGITGRDSVPAMLMPEEEVLDRSTSRQLRRFLSSFASGMMADPTQLGTGGRGNLTVDMTVARPTSYLDMLDLGEAAAVAAQLVAEADL